VYQEGGTGAEVSAGGGLGYVSATHQSLHPVPGATVLTHYRALGDDASARQQVLTQPWTHWRDQTLADLQAAHPDLASRVAEVAVARYGHAMVMPTPGVMSKMAACRNAVLNSLLSKSSSLRFAHSDWAGYSVFEEAFTMGHLAVV
jgi:hypothetical protein